MLWMNCAERKPQTKLFIITKSNHTFQNVSMKTNYFKDRSTHDLFYEFMSNGIFLHSQAWEVDDSKIDKK